MFRLFIEKDFESKRGKKRKKKEKRKCKIMIYVEFLTKAEIYCSYL